MVAVLEEKGSHKMARRVCEPRNRRGRGGRRERVAETEVEVAKTEVEEAAAVKVATKVELGIALRMDPHGPDSQRGRERVCSLLGAGGMHFEVQERPSRTARWWLGMRTLA